MSKSKILLEGLIMRTNKRISIFLIDITNHHRLGEHPCPLRLCAYYMQSIRALQYSKIALYTKSYNCKQN